MISSISNYYISTYGSKTLTKYDTHKKSELRNIYNSIVKVNKYSPLFSIRNTPNLQKYAIDLKENIRNLENVTASLNADEQGSNSGFARKKAYSSDEDILEVQYNTDMPNSQTGSTYQLEIQNLAMPQVNTGNYLNPDNMALQKGTYSFDINIGDYSYEFRYDIEKTDTNKSVQEKLARLINRSNIGITADIVNNEDENKYALRLTSTATGTLPEEKKLFEVMDSKGGTSGSVGYLGIQQTTQNSQNANFTVNGMEHYASSNHFTINQAFDITLHDVTQPKRPVTIGFKTDVDSVLENVQHLVDGYNEVVDFASNAAEDAAVNNKLLKDVTLVARKHRNALESSGLNIAGNGKLEMDSSLIIQSANEGTLRDTLDDLMDFKNDLSRKSREISINPMDYINKKLISYPNPNHSKVFVSPYVTSLYSGMMFNGYV